jgi:hypothetical protein
LPFATIWKNVEDLMLSEMSGTERQIPHGFTSIEYKKADLIEVESRIMITKDWGK